MLHRLLSSMDALDQSSYYQLYNDVALRIICVCLMSMHTGAVIPCATSCIEIMESDSPASGRMLERAWLKWEPTKIQKLRVYDNQDMAPQNQQFKSWIPIPTVSGGWVGGEGFCGGGIVVLTKEIIPDIWSVTHKC